MPDKQKERDALIEHLALNIGKESPVAKTLVGAMRGASATDSMLEKVLARLGLIEPADTPLPAVLPPTPQRLVTGNAQLDAASELMPLEQRRELERLVSERKVGVGPLDWKPGRYHSGQFNHNNDTLTINSELMRYPAERLAKTLTHESTHSMQTPGKPMRDDLAPEWIKGRDPYRDNPLEVEARLAADKLKPAKEPGFWGKVVVK